MTVAAIQMTSGAEVAGNLATARRLLAQAAAAGAQVAVLPEGSVAVTVITVVPTPTSVPRTGACVRVTPQLSEAATPPRKFGTLAWQFPSAEPVWSAAQVVITGGVVSLTVKVTEWVDELA